MSLKRKIEEIENKMDVGKKFPGYIHKPVFHIGFALILVLVLYSVLTFGIDKNWAYMECQQPQCVNPYQLCEEPTKPTQILNDVKCEYFLENPCNGVNCEQYLVKEGEIIGSKPPFIVENGFLIIITIIGLSLGINHLLWVRKK